MRLFPTRSTSGPAYISKGMRNVNLIEIRSGRRPRAYTMHLSESAHFEVKTSTLAHLCAFCGTYFPNICLAPAAARSALGVVCMTKRTS